MPLLPRPDGTFVARAPTLRRLMPFLMTTRNESVVYFEQLVEVGAAQTFLERLNAGRPAERRVTLFQLVLEGMARTIAKRPMLNRFVVGRRLYQRGTIELSFAVKKELSDHGGLTTVKIALDPAASLDASIEKIGGSVGQGRGKERLRSEKEMDIITLLPRFLVRLVMRAQRVLDYFNLLPGAILDGDPPLLERPSGQPRQRGPR